MYFIFGQDSAELLGTTVTLDAGLIELEAIEGVVVSITKGDMHLDDVQSSTPASP